jgi:hypothetical protein
MIRADRGSRLTAGDHAVVLCSPAAKDLDLYSRGLVT